MVALKAQLRNGRPLLDDEAVRNHAVDEAPAALSREDEDELIARFAAADRGEVVAYDSIDSMIHDLCQ